MPTPTNHKTAQTRTLAHPAEIACTSIPRKEPKQRRGVDLGVSIVRRAENCFLFFNDLFDSKVWGFNPCYAEGALLGQFCHDS